MNDKKALAMLGNVIRRQMRAFLATHGISPTNSNKMRTPELKTRTASLLRIDLRLSRGQSHHQIHDELKARGFTGDVPKFDPNKLLREAKAAAEVGDTPFTAKLRRIMEPKKRSPIPRGPEFYKTDEWREVRYRALKLHGGCCQCCGARPSPGHPLHIDHIKPRSKFPELELDLNNLQVLCEDCNLGKRAWDDTDWRNVVPIRRA